MVLGDVWVCSGQSNMVMRMRETADADADIAMVRRGNGAKNIRMFRLGKAASPEEEADLVGLDSPGAESEDWEAWHTSQEEEPVKEFSAICLLTAFYWSKYLGSQHVS